MMRMQKVNEEEEVLRRKKDGRRWAANAIVACLGLAAEKFHHRLFFASYQCRVSTQFKVYMCKTIGILMRREDSILDGLIPYPKSCILILSPG